MKFSKLTKNADMSHVIECDDMNEDILIRKLPDEIADKKAFKLKEGQYAILYKAGKVYDAINKKGMYEIEASKQSKSRREAIKWKEEFVSPKKDNSPLCIIVFNMNEITENTFFIDKPIEYVDWTKQEPLKAMFTCKGKFNFRIDDPALFFSRVYGIREHYSKLELIEQIRKNAVSSIQEGINELSEEYRLSIELVKTKTSELEIKLKENEYDSKLKMRGIKITYFELTELDITAEEGEIDEPSDSLVLKRLNSVLDKIKENRKIIDKENYKITVSDKGEIIYKSNIGICTRCANLLERDSKYCKICGAKI